jgi:hypothetical protein
MACNRFAFGVLVAVLGCAGSAFAQTPLFEACLAPQQHAAPANVPGVHVKLLSGSVQRAANAVTLSGMVSVAMASCTPGSTAITDVPPVYTLRDASVTLQRVVTGQVRAPLPATGSTQVASGGNAGVRVGGQQIAATSVTKTIAASTPSGVTVETAYSSLHAKGQLEISMDGTPAGAFLVKDFEIDANTDAASLIRVIAGQVSLLGCALQVAPGSQVDRTGLTLKASAMGCDGVQFANVMLRVGANGRISGVGQHSFINNVSIDASFAVEDKALTGAGEWKGAPQVVLANQPVPGLDLVIRSPLIRTKFERKLEGNRFRQSFALTFDAERIEERTQAKMANGEPWASAYVDPQPSTISGSATNLALPALSTPQDMLRATRDTCLNAANKVIDNKLTTNVNEHDAAVNACWSANPAPPSIPSAPHSITLQLSVVAS